MLELDEHADAQGALWPKRLLLFDRCEGGLGIAERVHTVMLPMLEDACELMAECECSTGCWCCVHTSKCTEYNEATDKKAAIRIVQELLAAASHPIVGQSCTSAEAGPSGPGLTSRSTETLEEMPSMLSRSSKWRNVLNLVGGCSCRGRWLMCPAHIAMVCSSTYAKHRQAPRVSTQDSAMRKSWHTRRQLILQRMSRL